MVWADVETYFVFDWEKQIPWSFCGTTFDCCVVVGVYAFIKFLLIYFVGRILVERMGSALPPAWSWKRKRKGLLNFCCFGENPSVLYIYVYLCGLPSPTSRTIWWDVLMCFFVHFSFTNREFFERMIWSRGFFASVRNFVWRLHTELWEIT